MVHPDVDPAVFAVVAAAGEAEFAATVRRNGRTGALGSTQAFDAGWEAPGWPDPAGALPWELAVNLSSAAASALGDLGALASAGRGSVTALPMARYILELCSDVAWLLMPGHGPHAVVTPREQLAAVYGFRLERVRRAWSYRLDAAAHYRDSRAKDPEFRAALTEWRTMVPPAERVEVPRLRQRAKALDDRIIDRDVSALPPLYDYLSASSHPNPHALDELTADGTFTIAADEMTGTLRLSCILLGAAWQACESYAGWPGDDVEAWLDMVDAELGV